MPKNSVSKKKRKKTKSVAKKARKNVKLSARKSSKKYRSSFMQPEEAAIVAVLDAEEEDELIEEEDELIEEEDELIEEEDELIEEEDELIEEEDELIEEEDEPAPKPKKEFSFKKAGAATALFFKKIGLAVLAFYRRLPKKAVLAVLIVAVAVSFFSLGYLLNRFSGVQQGGDAIDTIPIAPTAAEGSGPSVAGIILSKDGTPFKNATLELHSKVKKATTDENGYFHFHSAEIGKHKMYVLGGGGEVLAECEFEILLNENATNVTITENGASYSVEIPHESVVFEVEAVFEQGDTPALTFSDVNVIKKDGTLVSEDSAKRPENGGFLVTDIGHTVLDDGTVILPRGGVLLNDKILSENAGVIVLPDSTIKKVEEKLRTESGSMILEDGEIITRGGHVVSVGKHVILKNGETTVFEGDQPTFENDRAMLADSTVIDKSDSTVTLPNGTVIDLANKKILHKDGTVVDIETGAVNLPNDQDGGKVVVVSGETEWGSDTHVDIFAGIDKLYPGVNGEYVFEVKNYREEPVVFTMTVKDTHETPIPFEFVLKDRNGMEVDPQSISMNPDSSMRYTLYWKWPYESGDDAYDNSLGNSDNRSHTVVIQIRAKSAN